MAERAMTGSTSRRRKRRLRSWLRHERVTVAAALHHSASKSVGPETNDASRSQKTVNSKKKAVFFELYDEDTAGRSASLAEPRGPQERVQQLAVEQIADCALPWYRFSMSCAASRAERSARPNLAANRRVGFCERHGAGDRSAQDLQP